MELKKVFFKLENMLLGNGFLKGRADDGVSRRFESRHFADLVHELRHLDKTAAGPNEAVQTAGHVVGLLLSQTVRFER